MYNLEQSFCKTKLCIHIEELSRYGLTEFVHHEIKSLLGYLMSRASSYG